MTDLLSRLRAGEVLVADGAMGTMLFERGLRPGDCPEAWNLERPEALEEVARLYFAAGSQIVQTNTFGGTPLKLAPYGLDARCEQINAAAVAAVRRAVGVEAFVSGSCGPTGVMLQPYGDAEPAQVRESFARQTAALVEAGVDLLCIETMSDLAEALLALDAAHEVVAKSGREVPIAVTLTFDAKPRGFFTMMGTDVATAATELGNAKADLVGANCGNGIEVMIEIAKKFRAHTSLPLLIQSNAGLPQPSGDGVVYPDTPEFMAEKARELVAGGVSVIGGCCGTTPAHISAIKKRTPESDLSG